jgi:hypothetical protein
VVSLLAAYGVAPEKALLFSVCYGLALAVGSLPGAPVWLLYPFAAADSSRREEQPRPLAETHPSGPASDIA